MAETFVQELQFGQYQVGIGTEATGVQRRIIRIGSGGSLAPIIFTTDKTSNMVISNGGLTATSTGGAVETARANRGITTGKGYFEMHVDAVGSFSAICLTDATVAAANAFFGNGNTHGLTIGNETSTFNYSLGTTFTTGDTMAMAVDADLHRLWVLKNNTALAGNPSAGTGGYDISSFSGAIFPAYTGQTGTQIATFNFGATSFLFTPPTGFVGFNACS